ncbi:MULTISPECIES: tRNA pseudouridine(55) synthase TruB [unclassified Polaribacter]|jgi:tRNA pseudouridine55 synthase|uniref:tRNA pseudouridine(55) synthase TruB n=1 Tax=unclassified Polaribacter TaxID=196858 RepID=UPI00052E0115|nr:MULTISPECIES: tRNA pseudouridine(55) synthase TruB [unclassified Polaribacter]KGL59261.1 tRNA pseudouridine synthase B [Polaribacter sp. Hel1_33_49]MBT3741446.1 tRNA pseudouridine(55) synthase TruB [Polaribacter sp.]MBT4413699.1 tRNA pseudouridine(55) synthase TruB [Polaribacter sp.]MDG1195697.1 tRNA pseudouridine(55) synthase TruB [Polaribacter sp.]MDG1403764.1 tRNA pseudouridine(55) synthase TruB [Polaribacter sp.]
MNIEEYQKGQVLLIDKPLTWTSFQVVNKLRWEIKQRFNIKKIKVGHAGTLDPLATGLLIICTGKQTKEIHTYQNQVKEYTGTFTLGATTPSYDLETEIDQKFPTEHITEDLLKETTKQFIGDIQQKPPIFSAIKKDGKRLYELARKGETTEIKARIVKVLEFEITTINLPKVDFKVVCSKGTYIRSLASDFGNALNSGAHLSALRRTKIGDFSVDKSNSIEGFIKSLKVE